MGLGHPDLRWDPPGGPDAREPSSFTMSYGGSSVGISAGPDGIPGSLDDTHDAQGGGVADSVHWFRRSDNNPVIIDGTAIDIDTYSRSVTSNLPVGHSWAANANRRVAESLGAPFTQAVMYSRIDALQRLTGLTADEVNMVRMARTGRDRMAGTTDDYTVSLGYVADCGGADIVVQFRSLGPITPLAGCNSRVELSFSQNPLFAQHYSLVPAPGSSTLEIVVNDFYDWETADDIFFDSFESGDSSAWSARVP